MKTVVRFLTFLFLVVLFAGGSLIWQARKLFVPGTPGAKAMVFEIPQGASGAEVARLLKKEGVIQDEMSFRLLLRFHPKGGKLKAGIFRVEPSEPAYQVFERLLEAKQLTSQPCTFPEGLVIPQVAEILKTNAILPDTSKFIEEVRTHGKSYGDWLPANLEGYLYPETYQFAYRNTEKTVIEQMVGEFKRNILPTWEKKRAKSWLKSLHEVVILASLVEREAQVAQERGVIAGVYVNRLKKGMKLECDATIQYALGKQKQVLLFSDLKLDSPYNTYLYAGLPPGPIANPGKKSLEAAISPTPSEYLYYVRNDIKNDGSHVFSKTYSEHLQNCQKYQK